MFVGVLIQVAFARQVTSATINGQIDACDPSDAIGQYEYQYVTFDTDGQYRITETAAASGDLHTSIYANSFNPANPNANLMFPDTATTFVGLNPGDAPFTVVIVMHAVNGATGNWTVTIDGITPGTQFTLGANSITLGCPFSAINGQIDLCDPSDAVGQYEYQYVTFNTDGEYQLIETAAASGDLHTSIYANSFNPANPNANLMFPDTATTFVGLNPGDAPFTVVIVMHAVNGATGNWTVTVSGRTVGTRFTLGARSITVGGCALETDTPSPTATPTASATPSATATATASATPTDTPSATATSTASATPTDTPTSTASATPTDTPSPTATNTPTDAVPPLNTDTPTPTSTSTDGPSPTPSPTDTLDPLVTPSPTNTGASTGTVTPAPENCSFPIPPGSVQGRVLATVFALYDPNLDATTNVVLPAGTAWWIIDTAPGYYRLWIACQANPVWVSAFLVTPNYDAIWGGAALPDAGQ